VISVPVSLKAPEDGVVQINVVSGRTAVRVKSWLPEHVRGTSAVEMAGRLLPSTGGTSTAGELRVLCLAPGEWLAVSDLRHGAEVQEWIQCQIKTQSIVVVDLSDALAVIRIEGDGVRDVLSKGCGLDMHPRCFCVGRCARTRFAQIPVTIDCVDAPEVFELYVARSYFSYLRSWLSDCSWRV
jgi:sarcosine oxidase subunit gamma